VNVPVIRPEQSVLLWGRTLHRNTSGLCSECSLGVRYTLMTDEECRICREPGELHRPLRSPCKCAGSVRYVHEDCLHVWLRTTGYSHCELCGTAYRFEPVYRADAPTTLRLADLFWGLGDLVASGYARLARASLVAAAWLLVVPYATWIIWYAGFSKSWTDLEQIKNVGNLSTIVTRLSLGLVLCILIFLACLGLNAIQEHGREESRRTLQSLTNRRLGQTGYARRVPHPLHRRRSLWARQGIAVPAAGTQFPLTEERSLGSMAGIEDDAGGSEESDDSWPSSMTSTPAGEGRTAPSAAPSPQETQWTTEPNAPGLFSFLEHDSGEDLTLSEVLGLKGPLVNLLTNVIIVVISNAVVIDVFAVSPLLLGRFVLSLVFRLKGPVLKCLTLPLVHWVRLIADDDISRSLLDTGAAVSASSRNVPSIYSICIGYVVFLGLILSCIRLLERVHVRGGTARWQRFRNTLWILTFVQVTARAILVMMLEFIMLPLVFGMAVDLFAFPSGLGTVEVRFRSILETDTRNVLIHWTIGILYISGLSVLIGILREVLHPRLLRFLRDPNDPDFDPLREIVTRPLRFHLRRLGFSTALYVPVIGLTVYAPTQMVLWFSPNVFPLRLVSGLGSGWDIALCATVIGLFLSGLTRLAPLRSITQEVVAFWTHHSSRLLGLQHLVMRPTPQRTESPTPADVTSVPEPQVPAFSSRGSLLPVRIVLFAVLWFVFMSCSIALVLAIPLVIGRAVSTYLHVLAGDTLAEINDLMLYVLSLTCIGIIATVARTVYQTYQRGDLLALSVSVAEHMTQFLAIAGASVIWLVLLPYLLGCIMERNFALLATVPSSDVSFARWVQTWLRGFLPQRVLWPALFRPRGTSPSEHPALADCILPERLIFRRGAAPVLVFTNLLRICIFTACIAMLPLLFQALPGHESTQSGIFVLLHIAYIMLQLGVLAVFGRDRFCDLYRFLIEQIRNKRYLVAMRLLDYSERYHFHEG
jgi:hypothetical protein